MINYILRINTHEIRYQVSCVETNINLCLLFGHEDILDEQEYDLVAKLFHMGMRGEQLFPLLF